CPSKLSLFTHTITAYLQICKDSFKEEWSGAGRGNRTPMGLPPRDFEYISSLFLSSLKVLIRPCETLILLNLLGIESVRWSQVKSTQWKDSWAQFGHNLVVLI
ncbi:MAG TPA: hypothetical protein VFF49_04365, partial [Thermodesulfobacteriota bacterium]|nr:hypothetical protein [Thermodesulfobacteriota bacterium]